MPKFRTWVVGLFIAAFLCTRLMGLHLHLCFDGTEPAVSLQSQTQSLADSLNDLQRDVDDLKQADPIPMSDVDIDLTEQLLSKIAKATLDLPVLLLAFSLLFFIRRPAVPQPLFADFLLAPVARPRLRPPLRAPPR